MSNEDDDDRGLCYRKAWWRECAKTRLLSKALIAYHAWEQHCQNCSEVSIPCTLPSLATHAVGRSLRDEWFKIRAETGLPIEYKPSSETL
jgi:hypothetical protein